MLAAAPAAPAVQAPAPAAVPAVAASEDTTRTLNDLPDAVRNSVPRVAFGGYMYSPNPADRLVLVDKVLRHEGEEVAPGLMLEKLLPRGAVLNYRGYRYRVAF
jgi:general secretion pathway protein B